MVIKALHGFVVSAILFPACSNNILEMKFIRGKFLPHQAAYRAIVPTMYQCAEMCMKMNVCMSMTFDTILKECRLNKNAPPVSALKSGLKFVYADKSNIPVVSMLYYFYYFYFSFRVRVRVMM